MIPVKSTIRAVCWLIVFLSLSLQVNAQNSLFVQVLPPYTNRLADYANTPNKVVVTVMIHPSLSQHFSGKIFFRGKVRNASGDIEISSRPGFRPAIPVTLPAGAPGMPIVYTLPFHEIQTLFNWNNLIYNGISKDQIVQYGMPEDVYQFCVQVIDYETLEVLVEETCGPAINVSLYEPPIILNPINESVLMNAPIQSVLFNWSLSAGAPPTTRYTLRMVELTENVKDYEEALRAANYPFRFFETTVNTPNFLYTNAHPKLEPGKRYAFAVIASDPVTNSAFRNGGMSEIYTFEMEGPVMTVFQGSVPQQLEFIYPDHVNKYADVNSEKAFMLSWNWSALLQMAKSGQDVTLETLNDFCSEIGVAKYRLRFGEGQDPQRTSVPRNLLGAPEPPVQQKPLSFIRDITVRKDSHAILAHQFIITQSNADSIGFVDGKWYKASVDALDARGGVIHSATSLDFQFSIVPERAPIANLRGMIAYEFKGHPGTYHATNTPVTIEAYRQNPDWKPSTPGFVNIDPSFIPIGTMTAQTNREGVFDVDFELTGANVGDSVQFRVLSDNRYYLDYNFTGAAARLTDGTTHVNFGQLMAKTHGYSLKVYVRKKYENVVKVSSGVTFDDSLTELPEGVEVALYRKNKKDYIPPMEGDINDYAHMTGYTLVARAKTQIEIVSGKRAAYVQFDRLLAHAGGYGSNQSNAGNNNQLNSNMLNMTATTTNNLTLNQSNISLNSNMLNMTATTANANNNNQSNAGNNNQLNSNMLNMSATNANYSTLNMSDAFANTYNIAPLFVNGDEYYIKALNDPLESPYDAPSAGTPAANANIQAVAQPNVPAVTKTTTSVVTQTTASAVSQMNIPSSPNISTAQAQMVGNNPSAALNATVPSGGATKSYDIQYNAGYEMVSTLPNVLDYFANNYSKDGFVAEEKMYQLKLPAVFHEDSLYRHRTVTYEIVSVAPPTSKVKGRLVYRWYDDPTRRPMANTRFKVIVDYLVDDKVMSDKDGIANKTFSSFVYPDGSGFNMYDYHAVAGSGKTDAEGNFTVTINNYNMKGDLRDGTVSGNNLALNIPDWQQEAGNFGVGVAAANSSGAFAYIQSNLNIGTTVVGNDDGSFAIKSKLNLGFLGSAAASPVSPASPAYDYAAYLDETRKLHGPNPSPAPAAQPATSNIKRVFRIVPDNPYYHPSMDHFTVQPLENTEITAPQCSYVKEVRVEVTPHEWKKYENSVEKGIFDLPGNKGKKLEEAQMLIFRDPSFVRPADMPIGEGDNVHLVQKLPNPQYEMYSESLWSRTETEKAEYAQIESGVLKREYEYITLTKPGGTVTFKGLLMGSKDYWVYASSNTDKGTEHHQATFRPLTDLDSLLATGTNSRGVEFYQYNLCEDTELWFGRKAPPVKKQDMVMKPLQSRVFVRTLAAKTDQAIPGAIVKVGNSKFTIPGTQTEVVNDGIGNLMTDKDGYLQMLRSQYPLNEKVKKDQTTIYLQAIRAGYTPSKIYDGMMNLTGMQVTHQMHMEPGGKLNITVTGNDENGKLVGIPAYVRVDSANLAMTDNNGKLPNHPIPNMKGTTIEIKPRDLAYFNDTIIITEVKDTYTFNVQVYRKQHRMRIAVRDKVTKELIANAFATLGDMTAKQVQNRLIIQPCQFAFENVSVNNYTFVIRGPDGSNYIPVTANIKNVETKNWQDYTVYLEEGSSISGVVTLDGQPVRNAKVYLDVAQQTSTAGNTGTGVNISAGMGMQLGVATSTVNAATILNNAINNAPSAPAGEETVKDKDLHIAYTDVQGRYVLRGVPVKNNQKIDVLATLETTATVIGDCKQATIGSNGKAENVNLALKTYGGMVINNLYGFPMSVESLKENADQTVTVTGLIHWGVGISDFAVKDEYRQLRVEGVNFKAETLPDGRKVGVAVNASVPMQGVTGLKLGYLDGKYNVMLESPAYEWTVNTTGGKIVKVKRTPIELAISRTSDGLGSISGKMYIIDNSFNYTESYLNFTNGDDFYLATIEGGAVNNIIKTIISPLTEKETAVLNPFDNNPQSGTGGSTTQQSGTGGSTTTPPKTIVAGKTVVNSGVLSNFSSTFQAAFSSKVASMPPSPPRYYLSNGMGRPVSFKLLDFNATAKPDSSYLAQDGTIRLNVALKCKIQKAQPENFTVKIQEIVLDNNYVYPAKGSKLNVALGRWTLEVRDWEINPKEGGITSKNSVIRTSIIDIPMNWFALRADAFVMEKMNVNELAMGGDVTKVVMVGGAKNATIQWDNKVGTDMAGHWRFSISREGDNPAARTENLTGLFKSNGVAAGLDFSYLQILDNNEMLFQLAPGQEFRLYKNSLAKFTPYSTFNGPNYLNVTGIFNIGAPRTGDMTLKLQYTREGAQLLDIRSVEMDFAVPGNVHFTSVKMGDNSIDRNIEITEPEIKIWGYLHEMPLPTFNAMPAVLTAVPKRATVYQADIQNGWIAQLTANEAYIPGKNATAPDSKTGYRLEEVTGGMKVQGSDWTNLTYSGKMYDNRYNKNSSDYAQSGFVPGSPPSMTFSVYGDVSVNSNELGISGLNTPFGKFQTKYDFNKSELTGSLEVKTMIPFGPVNIMSGQVEFKSSSTGFYLAGALKSLITIPFIQGEYNMGFIIGNYPDISPVWPLVQSLKNPKLRSDCYAKELIKNKLSGFYFTVDRDLFNMGKPYFYLPVGWGSVHGYAGISADVYANFSPVVVGVSASAKLRGDASLNAITGTSISGYLDTKAGFDCMYRDGKFQAETDLRMTFGVQISQFPFGTVFNEDVEARASAGTGGFSFELKSANEVKECPPSYYK